MGAIPLCCNNTVIFYNRLKTQHILSAICQYYFAFLAKFFGRKEPKHVANNVK